MVNKVAPVIRTNELTKVYGHTRALSSLNLEVGAGETFGFIGPNGAGKTTAIRLFLDLIRPTSGSLSIFGLDSRQSAVALHERIGYLPGDLTLFDRLTGHQLFEWLGRVRKTYDPEYTNELVERLGLDPSRNLGHLSSGNRQKVGIVQAFMHQPELLILDEPTSGLDPVVQREFHRLVSDVTRQGATVFLSSHVLAEVEGICQRVATVVDGVLRRIDTVADLRARQRRRVSIVFTEPVDFDALSRVSGVGELHITQSDAGSPTAVELQLEGPMSNLIKFVAEYEIHDLVSEPVSLEDVFLETYEHVR